MEYEESDSCVKTDSSESKAIGLLIDIKKELNQLTGRLTPIMRSPVDGEDPKEKEPQSRLISELEGVRKMIIGITRKIDL